jgi:hypothetical protein
MKKVLFLGTLLALLHGTVQEGFNQSVAKCIIMILYGAPDPSKVGNQTSFEARLYRIQATPASELTFSDFSDPTLIRDINNVFLHFSSLPKTIQDQTRECGLAEVSKRAGQRCSAVYGSCSSRGEDKGLIHFQQCPQSFSDLYLDGYCYPKCPASYKPSLEGRKDTFRCPKDQVIFLKPYSTEEICLSFSNGRDCVELPQTLWISRCPPTHTQVLNFICLPICPPTWISDRKFCQKRTYKVLRTPWVPNFFDLIDPQPK